MIEIHNYEVLDSNHDEGVQSNGIDIVCWVMSYRHLPIFFKWRIVYLCHVTKFIIFTI